MREREFYKRIGSWAFLVVLLYLGACAEKVKNRDLGGDVSALADNQVININKECYEGSSKCPEYLAFIQGVDCNAVLVKNNLLVTSNACLDSVKCDEIQIVFPGLKEAPFQKLNCKEIIHGRVAELSGELVESEQSYKKRLSPSSVSFIKIEPVDRRNVSIAETISLDSDLYLNTLDNDQAYESEYFFRDESCYLIDRTYASPLHSSQSPYPAPLGGCYSRKETLCSAIVNGNGNLVGIVGSVFDEEDASELHNHSVLERKTRSVNLIHKAKCWSLGEHPGVNCKQESGVNQLEQRVTEILFKSQSNEKNEIILKHVESKTGVYWSRKDLEYTHWSDQEAFLLTHTPLCRFQEQELGAVNIEPGILVREGWRLKVEQKYYSINKVINLAQCN